MLVSRASVNCTDQMGCSPDAIKGWERGSKPLAVFAEKLALLDRKLSEKTRTLREEWLQ